MVKKVLEGRIEIVSVAVGSSSAAKVVMLDTSALALESEKALEDLTGRRKAAYPLLSFSCPRVKECAGTNPVLWV